MQRQIWRIEHRYFLGIAAVISLGCVLRFWDLTQFNTFVFDEVYYAQFAQSYLAGQAEFDAHPPLGKYLIAVGLWLSHRLSFLHVGFNAEPLNYRWMTAAVGSFVPLVVVGIAGVLTQNAAERDRTHNTPSQHRQHQFFALLAGTFIAIDGLFITESRYALINICMVFFGLLGHWLWLQATITPINTNKKSRREQSLLRLFAGIALGASVATKWNGLGYWLSLLLWEVWQASRISRPPARVKTLNGMLYGLVIPGLTYSLVWWPHLSLTGENFFTLQRTLLSFHDQLGTQSHIACSPWYTWPLLVKPFPYWYEETEAVVRTVSNLGNPLLWWLSSATVSLMSIGALFKRAASSSNNPVIAYLLIGYFSNWLPWIAVNRCTYLYLYMPAAVFAFMMLAWLVSQWLCSPVAAVRLMGWIMLSAIALAFAFWLPLSLGLPLSPEQLQTRWWLRSWI